MIDTSTRARALADTLANRNFAAEASARNARGEVCVTASSLRLEAIQAALAAAVGDAS